MMAFSSDQATTVLARPASAAASDQQPGLLPHPPAVEAEEATELATVMISEASILIEARPRLAPRAEGHSTSQPRWGSAPGRRWAAVVPEEVAPHDTPHGGTASQSSSGPGELSYPSLLPAALVAEAQAVAAPAMEAFSAVSVLWLPLLPEAFCPRRALAAQVAAAQAAMAATRTAWTLAFPPHEAAAYCSVAAMLLAARVAAAQGHHRWRQAGAVAMAVSPLSLEASGSGAPACLGICVSMEPCLVTAGSVTLPAPKLGQARAQTTWRHAAKPTPHFVPISTACWARAMCWYILV
mmetsp:Transcript_113606/g.253473  ORF Transcript_113606/g.253473 Transcript_113606/m.253473 type:complete len:296 (-) Transcript_113606:378-1265(-)